MGPVNLKNRSKCGIVQVTGGYSPEEKEAPTQSSTCTSLPSPAEVTTAAGTPHSGRPKLPFSLDTTIDNPPLSASCHAPSPNALTVHAFPQSPPANPSQVTLCPNMPSATATNSSVSALVYWCLLTAVWFENQSADSSNLLLWSVNVVKICQICLCLKLNHHKQ